MFSSIQKRKICFSVDAYLKILRTKNNKRKRIILSETRKKENSFQRVGRKYPQNWEKQKQVIFSNNHYSTEQQQQQQKNIAIVVCGKCGVV